MVSLAIRRCLCLARTREGGYPDAIRPSVLRLIAEDCLASLTRHHTKRIDHDFGIAFGRWLIAATVCSASGMVCRLLKRKKPDNAGTIHASDGQHDFHVLRYSFCSTPRRPSTRSRKPKTPTSNQGMNAFSVQRKIVKERQSPWIALRIVVVTIPCVGAANN